MDTAEKTPTLSRPDRFERMGSTFRAYLDPTGHPFCLCLAGA